MGELYRATMVGAAGWRKEVVLKMVLPHLAGDVEFIERFRQEARIAAGLRHGNIVAVLDFGELDGVPFLAMDWVDGWDLRRILRAVKERGETVPASLALLIGIEVCRALAHVHGAEDDNGAPLHLVHRDISPSNLLVSRSGEVRLTDFGIARTISQTVRTHTGQLRGKVSYMSPEQADGRPVDARSDLFSLGTVLYELLSGGIRAFDAEGDVETLARVQRAEFLPLATVVEGIDPEVAAAIDKAMARWPDDRWDDAHAMQVALTSVLFRETGPVTSRDLGSWARGLFPERTAEVPVVQGAMPDETATVAPIAPSSVSRPSVSGRWPTPAAEGRSSDLVTGSAGRPPVAAIPTQSARGSRSIGALLVLMFLVVGGVWWMWPAAPPAETAPASALVEIASTPTGATVYVNGVLMGVTTLRHSLPAGEHELRVSLAGHEPLAQTIRVDPVEGFRADLVLEAAPVLMTFESIPPGALVSIEGQAEPFVAGNAVALTPGRSVQVRMNLHGHLPWEGEVRPEPGRGRYVARLEADRTADQPDGTNLGTQAGDDPRETTRTPRTERDSEPSVRADGSGERSPRSGATNATAASNTRTTDPVAETSTLVLFFPDPPMVGELRLDGERVGRVETGQTIAVAPGTHVVELRNESAERSHRATVTLSDGQRLRHTVVWGP